MRRQLMMGIAAMGYGKAQSAIVQLAMVPALAASWGLPVYGQWIMLSTIPTFLAASDFGFTTAAANRLIGETARGETQEALTTFQTAMLIVVPLSLAILAIAVAASWLVPESLLDAHRGMPVEDAREVLTILSLYAVISLQWFLFGAVARAVGNQPLSTTVEASIQLAESIAVIVVALAGYGPVAAALAYLAVRLPGVALHMAIAFRKAAWLRLGFSCASQQRLRELFRPALAAMLLPLAHIGYLQGTAIAVGAAGGAQMVPVFTSLRTLSRVGLQLVSTVVLPLMPIFTAAHAKGDSTALARMSGLTIMMNLALGVAFALGIVMFGEALVHLWTNGVISPPRLMIDLVAIGLALSILWNPASYLLLAINRHEAYSFTFAACAIASTALTYVLVRQFGVTGAAMANLLLEAVMVPVVMISLRRHIGKVEWGLAPLRAVLPSRWRKHRPV